jgi:hypothetical protein
VRFITSISSCTSRTASGLAHRFGVIVGKLSDEFQFHGDRNIQVDPAGLGAIVNLAASKDEIIPRISTASCPVVTTHTADLLISLELPTVPNGCLCDRD